MRLSHIHEDESGAIAFAIPGPIDFHPMIMLQPDNRSYPMKVMDVNIICEPTPDQKFENPLDNIEDTFGRGRPVLCEINGKVSRKFGISSSWGAYQPFHIKFGCYNPPQTAAIFGPGSVRSYEIYHKQDLSVPFDKRWRKISRKRKKKTMQGGRLLKLPPQNEYASARYIIENIALPVLYKYQGIRAEHSRTIPSQFFQRIMKDAQDQHH